MENLEHPTLGPIAASVADERHTQAESRQNEAALLDRALRVMRQENRHSFQAHGVEFIRVTGEEKLRVRTSKNGATAEAIPDPPTDGDADEQGPESHVE